MTNKTQTQTQAHSDFNAWEAQLECYEKNLSPQRKKLLGRVAHDCLALRQASFEIPALQVSMRMNERLVRGHDPLKITLMTLGRELTERNIAFFRRLLIHARTLLFLRLTSRRLAQHNYGVELSANGLKSLYLATAELEMGHERLKSQTEELQNEIDQLRDEYARFQIEEISHEAAHSFGPKRIPGERPWEGLSRLLKGIAIQTRQDPERERNLKKAQQIFARRSELLLGECGQLLGRDITADSPQRMHTLKRIRKYVTEMRRLEKEMEDSLSAAAMSEQTPSLLVKKMSGRDTTS
jgi:hypothetical protein